MESHAGMCICAGIQNDAVVGEPHLLHLVNQFSLNVALVVIQMDVWIVCTQFWQIIIEGIAAVDAWLTDAEQIQVRAIYDENFHN